MINEHPDPGRLADAFHAAFVTTYSTLARQKYRRHAGHFPYHGQDVHVIYGGNRWWQILCTPGQRSGNIRVGPVGRYTIEAVDTVTFPDLATLPDETSPRKEEFRLAMGVDFFIYHEAFAPPGPASESDIVAAATALARELVDRHGASFLEIEELKARVAKMRNASQIVHDMDEALACLLSEHYRAAVVTACATAESAIVGRLEELGHPIRQEERSRVLGHEHHSFAGMVAEAYRSGAITVKTRDRLELLDGLRRGTDHCRPDATIEDDAAFTWLTLQHLLRDLTR